MRTILARIMLMLSCDLFFSFETNKVLQCQSAHRFSGISSWLAKFQSLKILFLFISFCTHNFILVLEAIRVQQSKNISERTFDKSAKGT